MKTILIAGYYGFKNLGDELILSRIIEDIHSIDDQLQILVVSGDPQYTERIHGVKGISRFSPEDLRDAINFADMVIVGGGGLIQEYFGLDVTDFFKSFGHGVSFYAIPPLLAKIYRKPVFYWGMGVGPIFTEEGRKFAGWFYSLADFITLRDPNSLAILRKIYPEIQNVVLDQDPGLFIDVKKFTRSIPFDFPPEKLRIGLNLRPWFGMGNVVAAISAVLQDFFRDNKNFAIIPIPFDLSLDKPVLRNLLDQLPEENVCSCSFENFETPEEVLSLMSHLDFFIGVRLHSVITSSLLGIPTLALSYDLKTDEIANFFKLNVLRIEEVNAQNFSSELRGLVKRKREEPPSWKAEYKTPKLFRDFLSGTRDSETSKPTISSAGAENGGLWGYENFIKSLRAELQEVISEKERLKSDLQKTKGVLSGKEETIRKMLSREEEQKRLVHQVEEKEQEIRNLNLEIQRWAAEVALVKSGLAWRFASRYHSMRTRHPFLEKIHRIIKWILFRHPPAAGIPTGTAAPGEGQSMREEIRSFLAAQGGQPLILIHAAVKYVESEGQRSVRLSQSFGRAGNSVVYVYWDWPGEERARGEAGAGLFVLARSEFLSAGKELLKVLRRPEHANILILEYPDPEMLPWLAEANALGFRTVYDMLDDWEDFHRLGQAEWYDGEAERFILRNCRWGFTVTPVLQGKFADFDLQLLPNGFDPGKLSDSPAEPLERRSLNAGYFGYLSDAWFDWPLLTAVAQSDPDVFFHILGYGMPAGIHLPPNIRYYGKVLPNRLSGYVKNWDVCMIPFKEGSLARAADPIKLYEYLYFRKPVVTTGMPHLEAAPYVINAEGSPDRFREALRKAKEFKMESDLIEKFLSGKTWEDRARQMLREVEAGR